MNNILLYIKKVKYNIEYNNDLYFTKNKNKTIKIIFIN